MKSAAWNLKLYMPSAHDKMDRMYRYQRYFYDLTRKYYLLGRDKLIAEMDIRPGESVIEIGCGTGRNLSILAAMYPETEFFGLDASAQMMETAQAKIDKKGLENILLKTALADDFHFEETFGLDRGFDTIFFSYSISMIPTWRESIANALGNLRGGRSIYIVDFYDQRDLPKWFARVLRAWLRQFHVIYPALLIPHLGELQERGVGTLAVKPLYRSYSFIVEFTKT